MTLINYKANRMLKSALFCGITQCMVVIPYKYFGQPIGPIFKGQEIQEEYLLSSL